MTDHTLMQLYKYIHIHYNPASARLTIGLLMFNALIQLKIYNIDDGSGGSDVGM